MVSPGSPPTAGQVGLLWTRCKPGKSTERREREQQLDEFTWQIASPNEHNRGSALLASLAMLEDFS